MTLADALAARHAGYLALAERLRTDPALPPAVRGVRFFDAAALITGPAALGLLQRRSPGWRQLPLRAALDRGPLRHLEAIGARLFRLNMAAAATLLAAGAASRDVDPARFDAEMVAVEQRAVGDYLRAHAVAPAARRGIDRLLAVASSRVLGIVFGVDARLVRAVRQARRRAGGRVSFFTTPTRVAIGLHLVEDLRHDLLYHPRPQGGGSSMRRTLLCLSLAAACATSSWAIDFDGLAKAGGNAFKAASLSDDDILSLTNQSCTELDSKSRIAPAGDKYAARLAKVVADMPSDVKGHPANYKVYLTKDVNAWAMANGCIRVYSGLMDMMDDDELRGVIGHEIGHVAKGHTKKAMQTAYGVAAARDLAAAKGGGVAALSQSQIGDFAEKLVNAQFSQSQESEADNYSFDLLTKRKLERKGLVTAFQKLAQLDGGKSSMLSSHPSSADRAANMQKRIDAKG